MPEPKGKPEMSSLFMDFAQYFELCIAQTQAQREAVFRVRYNVYCEEFGYEDAAGFADNLERDSFDERSINCLVTHRPSGLPAGCVRLVLSERAGDLPLESHSAAALDADFMGQFADRRQTVAEISRLAVDGHFRRRRGEQETRFGNTHTLHFAAREKRTFSLIAVSLFLAATAAADLQGRENCFAIMEPFLPAILRRTGVMVKRVGEDFDYKGVRAPYYLQVGDAVTAAPDELRLCYEVVREQFSSELTPELLRMAS